MNRVDKEKQKSLDKIQSGDIYEFSTWAKEDVYFYEVVRKTKSFVFFREISSEIVPFSDVPNEKKSLGLVGRMNDKGDIYRRPLQGKFTNEREFRRKIKRFECNEDVTDTIWNFNYISHKIDGVESYMLKIEKDDIWYRDKTHDRIAKQTNKTTTNDKVIKIQV